MGRTPTSWRPATASGRPRARTPSASCGSSRGRDTSSPTPRRTSAARSPSAATRAPGPRRGLTRRTCRTIRAGQDRGTATSGSAPRPGYFETDPAKNVGRAVAISSDPRTWPASWPDKANVPDDPGWPGSWDGYFGKRPAAGQESYTGMADDFYDGWKPFWYPDSRDTTRQGLGLRIGVRGFQWANPQAGNVIFWHYDITNEVTTEYNDNIVFGLYMDSG